MKLLSLLLACALSLCVANADEPSCEGARRSTCRSRAYRVQLGCRWSSGRCWQRPNVFFLGNSFTNHAAQKPVSKMPVMLARLARSGKKSAWTFDSRTQGGATLRTHATSSATLAAAFGRNRTILVLQEQSQMLALSESRCRCELRWDRE